MNSDALPVEEVTQDLSRPRGRPRKIQTDEDAPSVLHSQPCAFIKKFVNETSASGDRISVADTCGKGAHECAVLRLEGIRREENPPRSKKYTDHIYKWYINLGAVCEAHKDAIRQEITGLMPGNRLQAEIKSFVDQGFPTPDSEKTRLLWRPIDAPSLVNEHLVRIVEATDE